LNVGVGLGSGIRGSVTRRESSILRIRDGVGACAMTLTKRVKRGLGKHGLRVLMVVEQMRLCMQVQGRDGRVAGNEA
jgi:hypothetical protein